MRFPARFVLTVVSAFALFASLVFPVFAQSTPSAQNTLQILPISDGSVPSTVGTLSQGVLWGMFSVASCAIGGTDVTNPNKKCLGYNPQTGKFAYVDNQRGLTGMLINGISLLYSPPQFHVGSYVGYLKDNFGLVKKTYAASSTPTGFDQLAPIMNIWIAFRNVTYLLFVIVFVLVGFAIMLRAKIDPRTVMTIENQIPKLIVALVLISFSYAIAGFVIDVMWLMTFVTINLFASIDPAIKAQVSVLSQNISLNPLNVLNNMATGGILGLIMQPASSVYDIMVIMAKQVFNAYPALALPAYMPCFLQMIGSAIGGNWINLFSNVTNIPQCLQDSAIQTISGIGGIVAFLIFGFALMFALFRMYFTLLKSYALFLIYAIMGPFFIMLGALPGTKINFDNWIRHLLAYSLVFPYALGIMLLGKTISDVYSATSVGFVPPLIGVPQNAASAMGPLIGFAVLLLMPQALTMLQDALSAPDIKYLPGVGQMLAAGTQAYTTVVSKPWQRLTRRENKMEGLSEGVIRASLLGKSGSWQRRLLGDQGGKP